MIFLIFTASMLVGHKSRYFGREYSHLERGQVLERLRHIEHRSFEQSSAALLTYQECWCDWSAKSDVKVSALSLTERMLAEGDEQQRAGERGEGMILGKLSERGIFLVRSFARSYA